ncbi:MAG TPA: prolipoprotein diacylglyceryl transferase family protein [Bryobacteraceae bacterium]|nr:prolipoprotein diacylglyceryl transferase family protein [Bryobacteraceae bacterium]
MLLHVSSPLLDRFDPGLAWSLAMIVALAYAVHSARKAGLEPRSMYWAVVCALVGGLWGGHLMSLAVNGWDGGLLAVFQIGSGSKSLYGGLLLGGFSAWLCFRRRRLPVLAYADAAMPALALGYAVGRVGCFLNGDDYGALTRLPWAVVYPTSTEAYDAHFVRGWISPGAVWSLPVHPVQLYASLVSLLIFAILVSGRWKRPGSRLCLYLTLYGASRFFLEYLRGDFRAVLGPFSLPQLFSIAFVFAAGVLWVYTAGKAERAGRLQEAIAH